MVKIGLKMWSANADVLARAGLELLEAGIGDFFELYVVPGTLGQLPRWLPYRRFPVVIHAPHFRHGFNLADAGRERLNRAIFADVGVYAEALQTRCIICHPGTGGAAAETVRQVQGLADERIILENKPLLQMPEAIAEFGEAARYCRGARYEEFSDLLAATGRGCCFDVVHAMCTANALGLEPYAYAARFLALRPVVYHLTDMPSLADTLDAHIGLGEGELDVARVLRLLPEDAWMTLETPKRHADRLDDFHREVLWLRAGAPPRR